MSNPFSLPFELNNKSISAWLSQLKSSDVLLTSNQIYSVLSVLQKEQGNIDTVSFSIVVMRLTPVVIYLSGFLEQAIIKTPEQRKISKVSVRILRHLAFLHLCLAKRLSQQEQRVLHLNYALQIIGLVFKQYALSYERPSATLWEFMGECYVLALSDRILDIPVEEPLAEFRALSTIALALKRVLLFWLAKPHALSQQDINTLFEFCTLNSRLVNFAQSNVRVEPEFCWDYGDVEGFQPLFFRPKTLPEKYLLFHVADLLSSAQSKELSIQGADDLFEYLSHYQELIESTKFSLPRPFVAVSGFVQGVEFLAKHVRHGEISMLNSPSPKNLNFASLDLVKEKVKKKKGMERVNATDIWGGDEEKKAVRIEVLFGALKLVKTTHEHFFATEAMQVNLLESEVFIAYGADLKIFLGVCRLVAREQRGKIQRSMVQVFEGRVSLLTQVHSVTKRAAFLLQNEAGCELFLSSGKNTVGSVVKFDQAEVTLDRLVELTPSYMRYAVSVSES